MKDSDRPRAIRLQDYRPPEYLIDTVELHFDLDPEETQVSARLELRRNPAASAAEISGLCLQGEQLELLEIAIDGVPLGPEAFTADEQGLTLHQPPEQFRLETRVRIQPAANTALEGLYVSGDMLCTQCEAEGFRRITYFLDRPDVMARYRVSLAADPARYPVLLANGNPLGEEQLEDGRKLARWEDPFPKPSYLFALVAGELALVEDRYRTGSGREIALRIYVEPGNEDKCDHAMRSLKSAMRWDEERYGREYDLDLFMIVAVSHFNMGAMENKGLNVFNAKFILARSDTATDTDFAGIESVVAHEYFHNWTGNRITCRDWFQLSLKEGFTVFRDQEFSADQGWQAVKRIEDVRLLRARQFPEDAGPMAHPVRPDSYIEINNFYTATVYEKGAEVVRMQANLLGPERFRAATDRYFERFDGQAVTTDDFVDCMQAAGGLDLAQFRRWYAQAGTPVLECAEDFDATTGQYRLEIRQHTPPTPGQTEKASLHIPFALGLLDADGRDLPLVLADEVEKQPESASDRGVGVDTAAKVATASMLPNDAGSAAATRQITRVLELRKPVETFVFTGLKERPVPSLLRGFSAPVELRFPYSDADLSFLMAHDSDGFNRWDAAQMLAERLLLSLVADPEREIPDDFIQAFRRALTDSQAEPALIAEVLTLPSEGYLGERMAVVDVDGIHAARERLQREIGRTLRDELLAVRARLTDARNDESSPAAAGARALANRCLAYLVKAGAPEDLAAAQAQYDAQRNMTEVLAALQLLIETPQQNADPSQALQSDTDQSNVPQSDALRADRDLVQAASHSKAEATAGSPSRSDKGAGLTQGAVGQEPFTPSDDWGVPALADFFQRWSKDPLVLDKWFALQAQSGRADTLARVQALLSHPDFALTNPNRVRALIGAFAMNNPVRFHAADGAGYRFLADQVMALDALNPQIAARLLQALSRWRRQDAGRQAAMRAELERVGQREGLSSDVFEVVSKSLDG